MDPTATPIFSFRAAEDNEFLFSNAEEYEIQKREKANGGVGYNILRWPLIIFIATVLAFEFSFYFLVRAWVAIFETAVRYTKGKSIRRSRSAIEKATTLQEWREAAIQMDKTMGREEWKKSYESPYYDFRLVKSLKEQMYNHRKDDNIAKLADTIRVACRGNTGGIENEQLYSRTHIGTKNMVKSFVHQVVHGLQHVHDSKMSRAEKKRFFKDCLKGYGRTALCLSGGASMAFYHVGVVKCLLEQNMLPQVISGTSGGAMIAALICTRKDSELLAVLSDPHLLSNKINAKDESTWTLLTRLMKKGVIFDYQRWVEKMNWITTGDMTFKEAYELTGRILNITVIPTEKHSPPILLNFRTTPNVVVASAVLASASIPLLVQPCELVYKTEQGKLEPYHLIGKSWRDGSFKTDIPLKPLHKLFNVNYTIVSQANPHIAFFFFENRGSGGNPSLHRKGQGWRGGFIASSIEHFLKLDMLKWLRFLRALDLLPHVLGADGSFLFLQRFNGTVTIVPRPRFKDYISLTSHIDAEEFKRFTRVGEKITWPKLSMVANRMQIEELLIQYNLEYHNEIAPEITHSD